MTITGRGLGILAATLIAAATLNVGCVSPTQVNPPIVSTTPLGVSVRPAKPPDCAMPVLNAMPFTDYQQIALVDAWGDLAAKDDELLRYIKREGCQAGADAVVLTSQHTQHEGDLLRGAAPGRYGSIGPGSGENLEEGTHLPGDVSGGGKKHHAEVGEVGHPGHYMSGIAIVYTKNQGNSRAASDSGQ
jgi:hypothetical protein